VQRAVQREATEQLVVAQMFADLLIPDDRRVDDLPAWLRRKQRKMRSKTSAAERFKPAPFLSDSEPCESEVDVLDHESEFDPEHGVEAMWGMGSMLGYIKTKGLGWIPGVGSSVLMARKNATPRGGKLVWLTGCSETSFTDAHGLHGPMDAARQAMGSALSSELGRLGVHVSVVSTGPLDRRACSLANFSPHHAEWDPRTNASARSDETLAENHNALMRRVRLLARLSTLWAINEESCFWIVKQAVEARYPKRTYTLGLDVVVQSAIGYVPDSVWQLSSWILYERLGGRRCESWLLDYDTGPYWSWLPAAPLGRLLGWLSSYATRVKEKEQEDLD